MKNKKIKKIFISSVLVISVFGLFAFEQPGGRYFEIAKNLDIFATLFKEVNTYYVDEINPSQLMETGIDAMLESLDPYTNYIPEDEIEDFRTMTTGQYGGIGAVIGRRDGKSVILMPYENFPADKAGLRIGDVLMEIDGIDVSDKSTAEISKLLKGQFNTKVTMKVKRLGVEKPVEAVLTREKIKIDAVPYYGMVNANTGYMKLTEFTSGASKEVKKALLELKEKGAKSVIFDLRGNPGGLLSEAINISNLFIPKQSVVVSTKGKVEEWNKTYLTLNAPIDTKIPVAVLMSGRSASAAEIVAGVLQDYDRGLIVGTRSYGKGLVQATRPLSYNSQLKVTTAKYYTPSGRCIQEIDYSHRNADGSVVKFPDSLRQVFQTKNGRKVYDGNGITPDIKVEQSTLAPITISLLQKGMIFNYATKFASENKTITDAKNFSLSDAQYNQFVTWLSGKDYDYTTKVEASLDELTANSRKEQSYEEIATQISALEKELSHNKEKDLVTFKSEIKEQLEAEIASRYFLERGSIEASFSHDKDILAALKVLNNKEEYQSILGKK